MSASDIYGGRVYWFAISMALILSLIGGCKMENKTWIDKMLSEAESAWAEAEKTKGGQEARDAAVTSVVQKYFRPGMSREEAFVLLRQLEEDGFDVSENRHEGARNWPEGELKPYWGDEAAMERVQRQYPKGMSEFIATKTYGLVPQAMATKHVAISFRVLDGSEVISEVKGNIGASGI